MRSETSSRFAGSATVGSTPGQSTTGGERLPQSPGGRSLRITVHEVPSSDLFPNKARTLSHYRIADAVAPLRNSAKYDAIAAAMQVRSINGGAIFAGPVRVRVCVCWPKGRRMPDVDGLGLCCKGAIDGLTDAKIWDDDRQIVEVCYRQTTAADRQGRIEFDIEEVDVP